MGKHVKSLQKMMPRFVGSPSSEQTAPAINERANAFGLEGFRTDEFKVRAFDCGGLNPAHWGTPSVWRVNVMVCRLASVLPETAGRSCRRNPTRLVQYSTAFGWV